MHASLRSEKMVSRAPRLILSLSLSLSVSLSLSLRFPLSSSPPFPHSLAYSFSVSGPSLSLNPPPFLSLFLSPPRFSISSCFSLFSHQKAWNTREGSPPPLPPCPTRPPPPLHRKPNTKGIQARFSLPPPPLPPPLFAFPSPPHPPPPSPSRKVCVLNFQTTKASNKWVCPPHPHFPRHPPLPYLNILGNHEFPPPLPLPSALSERRGRDSPSPLSTGGDIPPPTPPSPKPSKRWRFLESVREWGRMWVRPVLVGMGVELREPSRLLLFLLCAPDSPETEPYPTGRGLGACMLELMAGLGGWGE